MQTLWKDCLYAFRMLVRNPGFTAVAVVALALGIGANTAIFSVVNAVLLRPLPYPNADRLVTFRQGDGADGEPQMASMSYPDFVDYGRQATSLEHVAAYTLASTKLTGRGAGDEPQSLAGAVASASLFPALGVGARLGRVFGVEEDKPGAAPVIVLSHDLWQRQFNADPRIVGAEITIADQATTVLGVMPAGFKFPVDAERVDYWMPLTANPGTAPMLTARGMSFIRVIAARAPQAAPAQAAAEVDAVVAALAAQYPQTHTNRIVRLVPLHESLVGDLRPALLILLGAVGCVLLIACANVANLLLARAAARGKEIAIRTALGASRMRVVRQLLTESVLLSLVGGSVGLLLSLWGVDLLVAASPADVPRIADVSLDNRVLIFTVGVSLLTGIVFGLAPALAASRLNLNESLKEGSRGATGGGGGLRRTRVRSALLVAEVALSVMLLIGAGLLIKSFFRLLSTDPGYATSRVLTFEVALSRQKYTEPRQHAAFFNEALARVAEVPGIEAAGATNLLPLDSTDTILSFNIEGRPRTAPGEDTIARHQVISPGYFRALGIALQRGRDFTTRDTNNSPHVVIVNEAFVKTYFGGENPIGRRLLMGDAEDDEPPREIVGIVADVRHKGLDAGAYPTYYLSYLQTPSHWMNLVVRSASDDPASLAPAVRRAVREVDTTQLISEMRTMDELVAQSVAPRRFNMLLLIAFAGLALTLAVVGIFGVMSYTVASRTHEIGTRMALGAQERDVLRLIVRQGMALTLAGVGVGLIGAYAATRVMASLLYGVSATDPATFAGVAALLVAVALVACYIPARRATKIDPLSALRYE